LILGMLCVSLAVAVVIGFSSMNSIFKISKVGPARPQLMNGG
jgi:hypothetical protein